jgi:N-acetylmuramoyl-L-alanine amidase
MKSIGKACIALLLFFTVIVLNTGPATAVSDKSATNPKTLLTKADESRNSLYSSSNRMKYRENWLNCIQKYENIHNQYPKSEQAPWALYRSAQVYTKLYQSSRLETDLDKALEIYEKITEEYSSHRLADDAQYKMGEIYYEYKKDPTQAYVEFLKVDVKFPNGDIRPKAKEMMDKLAAILGKNGDSEAVAIDSSSANKLTAVKNIRYWSTPSYTRVVIDLDGQVEYTFNLLEKDPDLNKPRRLYLDLENTYVGSGIETTIPIKDGLLQMARAAQYKDDIVRVVLDIDNIEDYKIFRLHDPFRIVVDVSGVEGKTEEKKTTAITESRPIGKGVRKPESPDDTVTLARQLGLSVKTIVIDPGHGGKDPGCYISDEIQEKDIVLDLAKKLKGRIEANLGCGVFLTRTEDIFLPLDERTAFANVKKADIFISLHVNSHKQGDIFGVETYFLNMATDERAVMLAAKENATSEKNISDLQSILNDLMLNTKISESSKLAYQVQDGVMTGIKKSFKTNKSLGVKQAPFYVLIGAEMPAILIETGFITNPTERKRLLNDKYRETLADGIVDGIDAYIKSIDQAHQGG